LILDPCLANADASRILCRMKTLEELPIKIDRERIAAFCRERGIRKMSVFGSVVRDDFDPQTSDVDVLVEFVPDRVPGWEFFGWGEDLEPIFGRKVDLMSRVGKYLWPRIKPDLTTIYEQS
jgi:predicted nucleotidyltransferase